MKEKIGVQLIPALIRFMDAITPIITAISNATPAQIDFAIALMGIVAAAGPVISILETVTKVFAFFGTGGAGASAVAWISATLIPAIAAIGAPVWLVIAALTALFLLWKNWDKISVTFKQLSFLIGLSMQKVGVTIKQIWELIKMSFMGIAKAIDFIILKWKQFQAAISGVKLPPALTPGSPTPFEMGLRGISSAMDNLSSKSLPKLNVGMDVSAGASNRAGTYIDNRRFSAGMGAAELQTALDSKFSAVLGV
jgi:hypothetical protein